MLLIFLECFLPVVSLFLFQNLVQLSLPPKSLFIYLFFYPPALAFALLLFHIMLPFLSFHTCLLYWDSLRSKPGFILFLYTQHVVKELAPCKYSICVIVEET